MGQINVMSMLNPPSAPCVRKFDGGFVPLLDVVVYPRFGSLKYTSNAVASICAFSIVFMLVAFAPLMIPFTYVTSWRQVFPAASENGARLTKYAARLVLPDGAQ